MMMAMATARSAIARRVCRRALSSAAADVADYAAADRDLVAHPYTSFTKPLPTYPVESAAGAMLRLEDGRDLVDGMSSWWAAVHGYRHPVLDRALHAQIDRMSHVMFGGVAHRPATELAEQLVALTGMDKVFLSDSGSIAIEVALKMAVQFHAREGSQATKSKFIALRRGYHGDTIGAMSVSDPDNGLHSLFQGVLAQQLFADAPEDHSDAAAELSARHVEQLLTADPQVAAVVVEPVVQGAGGMRFVSPLLLHRLRELCDRFGVLLIFDEIATGFGRTGTLFAGQQDARSFQPYVASSSGTAVAPSSTPSGGVQADIVCLGKALTGGYLTMGATLCSQRVSEGVSRDDMVFMHGPTFMGNPLASSVSLASVKLLLDSPWQDRVSRVERHLRERLAPAAALPGVQEVRVLGAIGVVEMRRPMDLAKAQRRLVDLGVWLRPFGKLLYTMPPFNCDQLSDEHLSKITDAMLELAADESLQVKPA